MATFKEQVEGLTSLSVGTTPTTAELTQFLQDGVKDVVNRIIKLKPDDVAKFTATTHDASDAGVTVTGQIFTVAREHDSTTILRPCEFIDPQDRYLATQADSLAYRSKYNPGFYVLNGKVHTIPASAGSNNDSVVTQVTYDNAVTHNDSGGGNIENFPVEYEYLVILYAGSRTILAYLGNIDSELPSDLVLPANPAPPTLSDNSVAALGTAPTYTKPSVSLDFGSVDSFINDDDPEMAGLKLNKVNSELTNFQADMQNELNEYNKENAEYQADMQKKIQDAQLSSQDDGQKLQKYSAEVSKYQAEVQSLVTDYNAKIAKLGAKYQWAASRYAALQQEYNNAFGLMTQKQGKG